MNNVDLIYNRHQSLFLVGKDRDHLLHFSQPSKFIHISAPFYLNSTAIVFSSSEAWITEKSALRYHTYV